MLVLELTDMLVVIFLWFEVDATLKVCSRHALKLLFKGKGSVMLLLKFPHPRCPKVVVTIMAVSHLHGRLVLPKFTVETKSLTDYKI